MKKMQTLLSIGIAILVMCLLGAAASENSPSAKTAGGTWSTHDIDQLFTTEETVFLTACGRGCRTMHGRIVLRQPALIVSSQSAADDAAEVVETVTHGCVGSQITYFHSSQSYGCVGGGMLSEAPRWPLLRAGYAAMSAPLWGVQARRDARRARRAAFWSGGGCW